MLPRLPFWLCLLAFPPLWLLAHRAAVLLDVGPGVSIWYPPAGLTFALLLLRPRWGAIPYVGIGYVVAIAPYVADPRHALLSALIPPSAYWIGACALRHFGGGVPRLDSVRSVALFLSGALATAALEAGHTQAFHETAP